MCEKERLIISKEREIVHIWAGMVTKVCKVKKKEKGEGGRLIHKNNVCISYEVLNDSLKHGTIKTLSLFSIYILNCYFHSLSQ